MKYPNNPSYSDDDYEGCVTAGRATGRPIPPPSEEELRALEVAWNDPRAYELSLTEGFASAGLVPKQTAHPQRALVPTAKDLIRFPHRTQVAFAARCARRVLPAFATVFSVSATDMQALDRATRIAEEFGLHGPNGVQAAEAIGGAGTVNGAGAPFAAAAATAASATGGDPTGAVASAAATAVELLCRVATFDTISQLTGPARDFERVRQLVEAERWTEETPVPPSVFGPMWEGAPPHWWRDDVLAGLLPESAI